jgi:hypothetical protein
MDFDWDWSLRHDLKTKGAGIIESISLRRDAHGHLIFVDAVIKEKRNKYEQRTKWVVVSIIGKPDELAELTEEFLFDLVRTRYGIQGRI